MAKLTTEIINRQAVPIICGGSAMYLNALINGYQPLQRLPIASVQKVVRMSYGNNYKTLILNLRKTPKQNKARVQRYLELYKIYGQNHRYYLNKHHQTQKIIIFMDINRKGYFKG